MSIGAKYIVIYRPHDKLNLDTIYYAANTMGDANQILESLPALGNTDCTLKGVKYIAKLTEFKE